VKKKKKDYAHSTAKYLLEQDLVTGKIPLDAKKMSSKDAYASRPEFAMHQGERLFPNRLSRSRKAARENKNTSALESAALANDRKIYPKKTTDQRGRPLWEGSAAQKKLIKDVKKGRHLTQTPSQLYY